MRRKSPWVFPSKRFSVTLLLPFFSLQALCLAGHRGVGGDAQLLSHLDDRRKRTVGGGWCWTAWKRGKKGPGGLVNNDKPKMKMDFLGPSVW